MIEVSESNNLGSVQSILGEMVVIRLPENPATGHSWDSSEWVFPDNIDLLYNKYKPSLPATTGGGIRRWVIKSTEVGEYPIKFGYQCRWEDNPSKTFSFNLVVVPKKEEKKHKNKTKES